MHKENNTEWKDQIDIELWETTWLLNFKERNKETYSFSKVIRKSLRDSIKYFEKEESKRAILSRLFLTKSLRLFRASILLIERGHYVESVILIRSLMEIIWVFSFILNKDTEKRIKKWFKMTGSTQRWTTKDLLDIYSESKDFKRFYEKSSTYAHTHVSGMGEFSSDDFFSYVEDGPMCGLDNYNKSAEKFEEVCFLTGTICELIGNNFIEKSRWLEIHEPIKSHPVFIDRTSNLSEPQIEIGKKILNDIVGS